MMSHTWMHRHTHTLLLISGFQLQMAAIIGIESLRICGIPDVTHKSTHTCMHRHIHANFRFSIANGCRYDRFVDSDIFLIYEYGIPGIPDVTHIHACTHTDTYTHTCQFQLFNYKWIPRDSQ